MTPEDDGFREIQLSGKQLVFLFMAATVVSVVIFLCGVLVGRGVRAERAATLQAEVLTASPVADPVPAPTLAIAESDPRDAAPPDVVGEPDGPNGAGEVPASEPEEAPVAVDRSGSRSSAPAAPIDTKPAVAKAAPAASKNASASAKASSTDPVAAKTTPPVAAATQNAAPAATPDAAPAATESSSRSGYAVQVAAVDGRGEADAMVKRLSDKGYAAYVEQPKGTRLFRVRVGTFRTRRDAQAIADKLQKEEKFKPWVTR